MLLLTPVFAIAAADRERQRLQPPLGDSVAALEAGSILAGIDADKRRMGLSLKRVTQADYAEGDWEVPDLDEVAQGDS